LVIVAQAVRNKAAIAHAAAPRMSPLPASLRHASVTERKIQLALETFLPKSLGDFEKISLIPDKTRFTTPATSGWLTSLTVS
jgi:hypothetical protein